MTRTRDEAEDLAWRVWRHFGSEEPSLGLELLDDEGTYWEMASRTEQPMPLMKKLLGDTFAMIPMSFSLIGSLVEGDRVALMVESFADLPDGKKYNNVYTFVTTLHPTEDRVINIREYVDTLHAHQTLIPAVMALAQASGTPSALLDLVESVDSSL